MLTLRTPHPLGTLLACRGREYDLAIHAHAMELAGRLHLAAAVETLWGNRDEVVRLLWIAVLNEGGGTR